MLYMFVILIIYLIYIVCIIYKRRISELSIWSQDVKMYFTPLQFTSVSPCNFCRANDHRPPKECRIPQITE